MKILNVLGKFISTHTRPTAAIASHPTVDRIKLISPRKASQQAPARIINQILIQYENFWKWIRSCFCYLSLEPGRSGVALKSLSNLSKC